MRGLGAYADGNWPQWPDYINTIIGSSVGAVVAWDWPSSIGSTGQKYLQIITKNQNVWFNATSTGANVPTTSQLAGSAGQTLVSNAVPLQSALPPGSTGGSMAFEAAGAASLRLWSK